MVKTIDILSNFCNGEKPKGFTAPAWKNSPDQIEILEKLGIGYGAKNPFAKRKSIRCDLINSFVSFILDRSFIHAR